VIEILTSVSYPIYCLYKRKLWFRDSKKNEEARVHFIPNLKKGVFVTLCAPVVINNIKNYRGACDDTK
jgi:hypothetical protein